jgi:hypothetical protein
MTTCPGCGHNHCCHTDEKFELVSTRNELGHKFTFSRWSCRKCGQWLRDEVESEPRS